MTIFKTKYTPDQIAEHLYFLCIMDKEANSSVQSYKENYEIEQIDPNVETELRFHIYALKLFTCIYAFTLWSGDAQKKDEILVSFNKIIRASMMIRPNNDSIWELVNNEIATYQNTITGKTSDWDELIFAIGKCFAISMGKSDFNFSQDKISSSSTRDTIVLMTIGSNVFMKFFLSIKEWLDKIK